MNHSPGPTVGVLGLGAMGLPVARRIAQGGYRVLGTDLSPDRVWRAQDVGVTASIDPLALSESEVLIVMVASPEDLESLSSNEIVGDSSAVELVCVMSTVGADAVIGFQQAVAARNIGVVDCPVTGGVAGAENGDLTIFASGSAFEVQLAAEVLSHVGAVKRCGEQVGDGQRLKLVNQVLATSHVVVAAEALALASRLGLDPETVLDLISDGAGASWMLSDRGPRMLENASTREAVTQLSILAKDAHLALDSASAVGLDAAVLRAAAGQWSQAMRLGLAQQDDSSVIEIYSN